MKIFLLSFIVFFSVFNFVQAQYLQEKKADEFLNRYLELKRFNGAVLVAKEEEILFNKGYGLADYEHDIPINNNTKFAITGLSEQFTAYIALKIIRQHRLSLNAPVKDYLADFKLGNGDSITLHRLLSHTSGLPDYPLIHELPKNQAFTKQDLIDHIANLPLESIAGVEYSYSKLNYNLVGILLEEITGKSYGELLKEYVTEPIGMKNTSLDNFSNIDKNRAKGYLRRNISAGWGNAPYLDLSNTFASQGILSTTEDLLLWINFIRQNYLQDKALQDMLSTSESGIEYGFRVKRSEVGEIEEIRSIGVYSSGFNSFSNLSINSRLTVIVLGNNRNPSSEDIADGLLAIFNNKDYNLPLPRKIVKVDKSKLQKLAGDYKINDNFIIKVLVEGDKVFVNDGMHPKFEVFPQSESQFFMEEVDAEIVFIKNEEGEVTKIGLKDDGFTNLFATKIKK